MFIKSTPFDEQKAIESIWALERYKKMYKCGDRVKIVYNDEETRTKSHTVMSQINVHKGKIIQVTDSLIVIKGQNYSQSVSYQQLLCRDVKVNRISTELIGVLGVEEC